MPETPDFEQIARQLLVDFDPDWHAETVERITEQLRLVWNARGASDTALLLDVAGFLTLLSQGIAIPNLQHQATDLLERVGKHVSTERERDA
jgi:hypothetical protein